MVGELVSFLRSASHCEVRAQQERDCSVGRSLFTSGHRKGVFRDGGSAWLNATLRFGACGNR